MPKEKEINHPCHLLSLPSAKRFWCRHCMTVFEDAITRWRHSRSCRYGVVNNFMRRRELEAKALQNTAVLNPVEARLEQSIQMCDLASTSGQVEVGPIAEPQILPGSEAFNCFICHQKFASMEEMRTHVKYPCSNSKIITSCAPYPRHSVPVFINAMPGQTCHWQIPSQHSQNMHSGATFVSTQTSQELPVQTSYEVDIQSQQEVESQYDDTSVVYDQSRSGTSDGLTPTNIYVNEQGETVIEVENLDLNSEGGELSLAHLLTQLSQQGIVFDKSRSAQLQAQQEITVSSDTTNTVYTTDTTYQQATLTSKEVVEEEQPTAEDAANTLAQLAGFRSFSRTGQIQPDSEIQLHSETNNYNSSFSGPSRQYKYTISAQPQPQVYEYEYSDSLSASDSPTFTDQQMALQQAMVSVSQEYDNVKIEQTTSEETIGYYSDSSNVAYVTDPNNHHQIQVDTEAISNIEDLKHNGVESDGMLIQECPVEINESGQLIIAPTTTSAQHILETHTEYVESEGHKVKDVEMLLLPTPEGSTFNANVNINGSLQNSENDESSIMAQGSPTHSQTSSDEFATQTVSLHDIVDSKCKTLTFVGHTLIPEVSKSCFASSELDLPAVTYSLRQETQYNIREDSAVASETTGNLSDPLPIEDITACPATISVTSASIIPTGRTVDISH